VISLIFYYAKILNKDYSVREGKASLTHLELTCTKTQLLLQCINKIKQATQKAFPMKSTSSGIEQDTVLKKQLQYWQKTLDGIPASLHLYTDKPRPTKQTFQSAFYSYQLPRNLLEKLYEIERIYGSSLFMILLAAFKVLLYHYTSQEDLVIGTPIFNKNSLKLDNLPTSSVNRLALRTNCSGNPKFLDFLEQVKEGTLNAYENQDTPFEQIVDHLNITRNKSYHPVFQVMFALQNIEQKSIGIDSWNVDSKAVGYDLFLLAKTSEDGLLLELQYASDLFYEETMMRMLKNFECLLNSIVDNPEQEIEELSILSHEEYDLVINKWNNTFKEYPQDKCVHQLFEEQVAKTPNKVAVVFEES